MRKKFIHILLMFTILIGCILLTPVNTYAGKQEIETTAEEDNKGVMGEVSKLSKIDPKDILLHGSLKGEDGEKLDKNLFTGLKNFTSSLNLNLQKIGIGLAFVMVVFCFAYMSFTGNATERAEQKTRVMHICILVWILCSYITLLGFIIDFAMSFKVSL